MQSFLKSSQGKILVTALVTFLATLGLAITITDEDHDGRPDRIEIVVSSPQGAKEIVVPPAATAQALRTDVGDHEKLRSEAPPGVTNEELQAADEQQEALAETDQLPIVTPNAAPEQEGCISRFVTNKSSRRGVRPRLFVMHYTVSPNRPGWSDVLSIVGLFDRPSFAASSNYVIDREGHCAYIVKESDKAWTQAGFNPVAISVEVINSGREDSLAGTVGLKKIGQVASDSMKRWEIPVRLGAISGCTVTRSGIVSHEMLKACGGGHVDVSPYPLSQVIAATQAARGPSTRVTAVDRRTCRKLNWWRQAGRPHGVPERRAIRRRNALSARNVTCFRRGPVKR